MPDFARALLVSASLQGNGQSLEWAWSKCSCGDGFILEVMEVVHVAGNCLAGLGAFV